MTQYTGEYIDITPTWLGILPALVAIVESGDAEGRKVANEELRRMAGLADAHVSTLRNLLPLAKALREAIDNAVATTTGTDTPEGRKALSDLLVAARELATRL